MHGDLGADKMSKMEKAKINKNGQESHNWTVRCLSIFSTLKKRAQSEGGGGGGGG